MNELSVLLVDDHAIVIEGLRGLLAGTSGIRVVGTAGTGAKAVEQAATLKPEIIVMDISLPDMTGIDATRAILAVNSDTKIIVLSMHRSDNYLKAAFEAGAWGYVLKDATFEELIVAIKQVHSGSKYVGSLMSDIVIDGFLSSAERAPKLTDRLTPREREILILLAEGKTAKEVGSRTGINQKTVDAHRKNMMEKLGVNSVAELTRLAIREGLIAL